VTARDAQPDPAAETLGPAGSDIRQAREQFISLWGQMGSNWGVPRTMAEVHALLYIVGEPLNTDAVMAALGISRGSASTTLRTLVEWGIIGRVHVRGDRKEYFRAEQDVWKLFRVILRERKKREVDPLLESLRACREVTEDACVSRSRKIDPAAAELQSHNERLDGMIDFVAMIDLISEQLINPASSDDAGPSGLEIAAKLLEQAS
jgi:HTH-type transcriptional regulator, glycine betaine synthesis regulator